MSNTLLKLARKAATGSPSRKAVLCFLADTANDKQGGKTKWYSMRGIAEACELSIPTVKRAVRDLKRQGHIGVDSGKGRWQKNIYTVHPIVTETEDEEEVENDEGEFNGITVIPLSDSTDSTSTTNGITVSHEWYHSDPLMVSQGATNGITVIHPNQEEPKEPILTQPPAPIESANASSHFDSPPSSLFDDDDSLSIPNVISEKKTGAQKEKESDEAKEDDILRRIMAMPTVEKPPEAKEEDDEAMTDEEWEEWRKKSEEFIWAKYPKHRAKKELKADFMLLIRREVKDDELAAVGKGLGRWLSSVKWREEAGQYVPSPLKFLDEERWKYPPQPKAVPGWDY